MPDESFRFVLDPIVTERNARLLIDVLVLFAGGATSEELRRKFEQATGYKRQTYYEALRFLKHKRWIVGGGASKLFQLNPDGSWKPTKTSGGEKMEREQLAHMVDSQLQQIGELNDEVERLRDWVSGGDANGANNVALSNLIKIVADNSASPRQRLRAAAAVLSYQTPNDVTDFVKKYLESLCGSDEATDYKIEASELLRKHEVPRIASATVRPHYRDDQGTESERREAWRSYLLKQKKWRLVKDTEAGSLEPDAPYRLPPGWCDEFYRDDFMPPPSGWPPWS